MQAIHCDQGILIRYSFDTWNGEYFADNDCILLTDFVYLYPNCNGVICLESNWQGVGVSSGNELSPNRWSHYLNQCSPSWVQGHMWHQRPFHWQGLILMPTRISNYIQYNKFWYEITYLLSNFTPQFSGYVITYPCCSPRAKMGTRAPSQYKDRLIYVWRFPC